LVQKYPDNNNIQLTAKSNLQKQASVLLFPNIPE